MNEKVLILAGCHRIEKDFRNVFKFDHTTLRPSLARKAGEQFSRAVVDLCRVLEDVAV